MIKSLIISTFVFLLIIATCCFLGQIETGKKAQNNYTLAKDNFDNCRFESALKLLKEEPPKNIAQDYYELKFDVLMNLDKINETKAVAKKLIELYPRNAFNYYLLSISYYNLSDYDNSEKYLKKAIKQDPKNSDYKIDLAGLYSEQDKISEAIKYYEEVKKENPKYEFAWAGIAAIYEHQKNYNKALVYRKEAAEKFSYNISDVYMLADLYMKMGDKKNAVLYYSKAAKMDVNKETDAREQYKILTGKSLYTASTPANQKVPALLVNKFVIVDALVNGCKGKFLINPEAQESAVYEKFLKKNKIKPETNEYGLYSTANGKKRVTPISYVDFKLGTLNVHNDRVSILPDTKGKKLDGIIGDDILAKTDFYVDQDKKVLVLER